MGIRGQRYAPPLYPQESHTVPIVQKVDWAPEPVLGTRTKSNLSRSGNKICEMGKGGVECHLRSYVRHGFHRSDFRDTHKCTTSRGYVLHRVSPKSVIKYGKHGQTLDTNLRTYVKHDSHRVDFHEIHGCLSFL